MKTEKSFIDRLQEEENLIQETKVKELLFFSFISYFMRNGNGFYTYEKLEKIFRVGNKDIISTLKIFEDEELTTLVIDYKFGGVDITFSQKALEMEDDEIMRETADIARKHFPLLWNMSEWIRYEHLKTKHIEEKPIYDYRYDD
jgi:hypothetical protein